MASQHNLMSCQLYGRVDWVTDNGKELGMFMKGTNDSTLRCVVKGPETEKMLANHLVQKGMMLSAAGLLDARCFRRADGTHTAELLCEASRLVVDEPYEGRLRGSVYANIKGIVHAWEDARSLIRTFVKPAGNGPDVLVSLALSNWLSRMTPESKARFLGALRKGRGFTATGQAEVGTFVAREGHRPVLQLAPSHFQLQT